MPRSFRRSTRRWLAVPVALAAAATALAQSGTVDFYARRPADPGGALLRLPRARTPARRKADLRLDRARGRATPRATAASAVDAWRPRGARASWRRIAATDADEVMPPPRSHRTLTASRRNACAQWIAAGRAVRRRTGRSCRPSPRRYRRCGRARRAADRRASCARGCAREGLDFGEAQTARCSRGA
jgi:hypothetical protein